ncbi:MAG: hypothetical protein ACLFPD_06190 [Desulfosudaceae bacterium]
MSLLSRIGAMLAAAACCGLVLTGCGGEKTGEAVKLEVPRGYMSVLEVEQDGRLLGFGPFEGYYFAPEQPDDLSRLKFVCFNERSFYTRDLPENAQLFEGEAVLTRLPAVDFEIPAADRINPVFFSAAPAAWLETRPAPQDEFLHFHSCYDSQGPARTGYWVRHVGLAEFTYDMGGRIGPDSPLYHEVTPGVDRDFARIVEFDRGP